MVKHVRNIIFQIFSEGLSVREVLRNYKIQTSI